MHLGLVRYKYNSTGGAERFINRLCSLLAPLERIGRLTVFTASWKRFDGMETSQPISDAVDFVKIPCFGTGRFLRTYSFLHNAGRTVRKFRGMVVQSHERLPGCSIFRAGDGVHRSWLKRLSLETGGAASHLRGFDPFHRLICRNELSMARDPRTLFVANSPLCKRDLMEHLDVPEGRIFLIPNSIDRSAWTVDADAVQSRMLRKQLLGLDPGKPCVIFVGSDFHRKGLKFLIEAVGMTKDVQLLVLGHDKSSSSFHSLANKHARGRVVFLGPTDHVKSFLEAADVFCLPSLYDSFSNAALEAACMGVPLVVTQSVGISDYLVHHGGGVICERESSSVKYAIETVLGNARQFSQRVLKLSEQFDESHLIGDWLSLYERASQLRDLR